MHNKLTFISLLLCFTLYFKSQAQFWQGNKIDYTRSTQGWKMRPAGNKVVWNFGFSLDELSQWTEDNYSVQKSVDGGLSWRSYDFPNSDSAGFISDIFGLNENIAFISFVDYANGNFLYKTTDGGNSWNNLQAPISTFINFSHFYDELNGIVVGDPDADFYFEIFKTTDGGLSWQKIANIDIPIAVEDEYGNAGDYSISGNHIWFGSTYGKVYHSADKGLHWEVYESIMATDEFPWGVVSDDNAICYTVYGGSITNAHRMFSRKPNDTSWTNITPADNRRFISGLSSVPGTDILVANSFSDWEDDSTFTTHLSFDRGLNWKMVSAGQRAGYTAFVSNQEGYACEIPYSYERPSEVAYRYIGNPITLIKSVLEDEFIKMNYNSLTKELNIKWDDKLLLSTVLIVNQDGKVIQQLDLSSNHSHSQKINLSSLIAGNYFAIVGDKSKWLNSKFLLVN